MCGQSVGFLVVRFLLVLSVVSFGVAGFFGLPGTDILIFTGLEKGRTFIGSWNPRTAVIRRHFQVRLDPGTLSHQEFRFCPFLSPALAGPRFSSWGRVEVPMLIIGPWACLAQQAPRRGPLVPGSSGKDVRVHAPWISGVHDFGGKQTLQPRRWAGPG